jgi:N utilization substance protein B
MQSIYAMHQSGSDNLEKIPFFYSIDNIQDLYIMLSSLIEICKTETIFHKSSLKHLATPEERKPTKSLSKSNFSILSENNSLSIALENRKINSP